MARILIAAWLVVMAGSLASPAFAQGKSTAAAQDTTQPGTPFQQLQAQLAALEQQVQAMRQQILALQTQISQVELRLEAQIATINGTLSSLQAQVTDGAETTASLGARVAANEAAIDALTTAVSALTSQLAETQALIAGNTGDVAVLQAHVSGLQALINAHTSQITVLQQQTAGLAQFQANLVNGTCATGTAIQDIASGGFLVCTQAGGGGLQTITRTVTSSLFTGSNYLTVACPAGYLATGSGFTVPAVVETQHYMASVNLATLAVTYGARSVTPITVAQSTTGATTATVQVQYLPLAFYGGYFFQAQVTCVRAQ